MQLELEKFYPPYNELIALLRLLHIMITRLHNSSSNNSNIAVEKDKVNILSDL